MATNDSKRRYCVTYRLDTYETATWYTRAYDREHARERFCEGADGFEDCDIVSIKAAEGPQTGRMERFADAHGAPGENDPIE